VALSVTVKAARPLATVSKPNLAANAATARLASPTWLASTTDKAMPSRTMHLLPLHDCDARPFADPRHQVEFAHQTLGAAQPQAEAIARRIAVAQRQLKVGNARSLI